MTDPNVNPYAGSGQSPWQPEQASSFSSSESGSVSADAGNAANIQQSSNNTYPGNGFVPPQTPYYNPYTQGAQPGQPDPSGQSAPYGQPAQPYAQNGQAPQSGQPSQPYSQPSYTQQQPYAQSPYTQPNPYTRPYPAYGAVPPYENQSYNGFAIAGFVCSFFVALVGLILSIIGLNQIKKQGGKGKGLAIAGIIISAAQFVIWIILIVLFAIAGVSYFADNLDDTYSDSPYSQYDDSDSHDLDDAFDAINSSLHGIHIESSLNA